MSSLKFKDQLQAWCFHPVVQGIIVTDILETGRKHMHQVTANEFHVGSVMVLLGCQALFP